MAIARLLPPGLVWSAARLEVTGNDVTDPRVRPPEKLATNMGIVFQDPSSCFNPARHVGSQITEVARVHIGMGRRAAHAAAIERLREVQVSAPELRMRQYPHELSGGMRQRAMIAMALTTSPALLIADEPTTALDVTVQAQVLRLLARLNAEHDMAILLVSHDIKVVSALCHRVCVMYAGRILEEVTAENLQRGLVCHPYTRALLAAAPKLDEDGRAGRLVPLPGPPAAPGACRSSGAHSRPGARWSNRSAVSSTPSSGRSANGVVRPVTSRLDLWSNRLSATETNGGEQRAGLRAVAVSAGYAGGPARY